MRITAKQLGLFLLALPPCVLVEATPTDAADEAKVSHSFLATGTETYILDGAGKVTWRSPLPSRDGWVLDNGNVLLAVTKCKDYPGGAAVEVTREGKVVFAFKGTQSEVN